MSTLPPSSLSLPSDLPPSASVSSESSINSSTSTSTSPSIGKQQNEKGTTINNNEVIGPPPIQFVEFAAKYILHLHYCHYHHHHHHHHHPHQHQQDETENVTTVELVGAADDDEEEEEYYTGDATTTDSRISLRELIHQKANQEADCILNNCHYSSIDIENDIDNFDDDTSTGDDDDINSNRFEIQNTTDDVGQQLLLQKKPRIYDQHPHHHQQQQQYQVDPISTRTKKKRKTSASIS